MSENHYKLPRHAGISLCETIKLDSKYSKLLALTQLIVNLYQNKYFFWKTTQIEWGKLDIEKSEPSPPQSSDAVNKTWQVKIQLPDMGLLDEQCIV